MHERIYGNKECLYMLINTILSIYDARLISIRNLCIFVLLYSCTCLLLQIYIHTYTHTHTHAYAQLHRHMHTRSLGYRFFLATLVHIHACMCVWEIVTMYTYTHHPYIHVQKIYTFCTCLYKIFSASSTTSHARV